MPRVLITGATGYVGGELTRYLASDACYKIRCLVRDVRKADGLRLPGVELFKSDVQDKTALTKSLEGVDTAFYLIHSMGSAAGFSDLDRAAAENFAQCASGSALRKIIYLGGLGASGKDLSAHLQSRQEVGEILRSKFSGVVVEFRAAVIIGTGSLSFELLRALVERLPAMVTPRWVRVPTQPIYIEAVLEYLKQALDKDFSSSAVFEIGGPDTVSYLDLMHEYASARGLKRVILPVPVLTPRLSSLWLKLVAPKYARVGRRLIESLKCATVVADSSAAREFSVKPVAVSDAVRLALAQEPSALPSWGQEVSKFQKRAG